MCAEIWMWKDVSVGMDGGGGGGAKVEDDVGTMVMCPLDL